MDPVSDVESCSVSSNNIRHVTTNTARYLKTRTVFQKRHACSAATAQSITNRKRTVNDWSKLLVLICASRKPRTNRLEQKFDLRHAIPIDSHLHRCRLHRCEDCRTQSKRLVKSRTNRANGSFGDPRERLVAGLSRWDDIRPLIDDKPGNGLPLVNRPNTNPIENRNGQRECSSRN